ncbi:MAG: orotate phosphoribosyltransferase [Thermoguttaceae bacterium]|nr:orotate phosphoribosyltransferase [Thermoguttaceae bacterium]
MYDKEELKALVRERSLKFGDFVLASGKKAKYYLDGKMTTLDSRGATLVGEGILDLLQGDDNFPSAVGGMSIGADPICAAVLTIAGVRGIDLKGFLVRKESKGHGTNKFVEGPVKAGDRVVVVEDVVTTGGSSLKAIDRLEEAGIKVDGVIAIIDRMEGGAQAFEERGYSFRSLLKITDFGIDPPQD